MYDVWRQKLDKAINDAHSWMVTSEDTKQIQAIKKCIDDNNKLARSINDLLR